MKDIFDGMNTSFLNEGEKTYVFKKPFPAIPEPSGRMGISNYPVYFNEQFVFLTDKLVSHLRSSSNDERYRMKEEFGTVRRNDGDLSSRPEYAYKNNLSDLIYTVMRNDDRGALLNLFFIALSDLFSRAVINRFGDDDSKYLLNGIVYDIHNSALKRTMTLFKNQFPFIYDKNYKDMNMGLVEHSIRDQLAFFGVSESTPPRDILFPLSSKRINSRFLISAQSFDAIESVLDKKLKEFRKNRYYDSLVARLGLTERISAEGAAKDLKVAKMLLSSEPLMSALSKNPVLKSEQEKLRISFQEILYLYYDMLISFKRHRILSHHRKKIVRMQGGATAERLNQDFAHGRLFWFEKGRVTHRRIVQASVFFLDIRNFSARTKFLGPEETVRQLREIFDPAPEIIGGNGGNIDKLMGDGLMAIFPVSDDVRFASLNAVRAAISMYEHFRSVKKTVDFEDVGIGIATGEVMMAQLGNFTAIGDTVNLASRLSSSKRAAEFGSDGLIEVFHGPTYRIADRISDGETEKRDGIMRKVDINEKGDLFNVGIALDGETFDDLKKKLGLKPVMLGKDYYYIYYDESMRKNLAFRLAGRASLKGFDKKRVFEVLWDEASIAAIKKNMSSDPGLNAKLKEWFGDRDKEKK